MHQYMYSDCVAYYVTHCLAVFDDNDDDEGRINF